MKAHLAESLIGIEILIDDCTCPIAQVPNLEVGWHLCRLINQGIEESLHRDLAFVSALERHLAAFSGLMSDDIRRDEA